MRSLMRWVRYVTNMEINLLFRGGKAVSYKLGLVILFFFLYNARIKVYIRVQFFLQMFRI